MCVYLTCRLACMFNLRIDGNSEFDEHSKGVIDECFAKKNELAFNIIKSQAQAFYNYTPLYLATDANCNMFITSNTVGTYFRDMWYHYFDDRRRLWNMNIEFLVGQ